MTNPSRTTRTMRMIRLYQRPLRGSAIKISRGKVNANPMYPPATGSKEKPQRRRTSPADKVSSPPPNANHLAYLAYLRFPQHSTLIPLVSSCPYSLMAVVSPLPLVFFVSSCPRSLGVVVKKTNFVYFVSFVVRYFSPPYYEKKTPSMQCLPPSSAARPRSTRRLPR